VTSRRYSGPTTASCQWHVGYVAAADARPREPLAASRRPSFMRARSAGAPAQRLPAALRWRAGPTTVRVLMASDGGTGLVGAAATAPAGVLLIESGGALVLTADTTDR
jgi:hypothetical protein